jgi:hypothetical protein
VVGERYGEIFTRFLSPRRSTFWTSPGFRSLTQRFRRQTDPSAAMLARSTGEEFGATGGSDRADPAVSDGPAPLSACRFQLRSKSGRIPNTSLREGLVVSFAICMASSSYVAVNCLRFSSMDHLGVRLLHRRASLSVHDSRGVAEATTPTTSVLRSEAELPEVVVKVPILEDAPMLPRHRSERDVIRPPRICLSPNHQRLKRVPESIDLARPRFFR